ncbi:hypothetical protein [Streptomyces sp. NBC_00140]|uniref:hypothetical protein n=1 Tax=Streptomyces sp. NBC_00140 TaxID=2975664 RepID=UPI00224FF677|nr:hypothetical protein [Streptomyces sp. NBC_00140]MCX5338119.1 hypothetical protein [Streptomyces sp. NBC_00140]
MPRRNSNVDTVRREPVPDLARALLSWAGPRSTLIPTKPKPSVKRRRFRIHGGER